MTELIKLLSISDLKWVNAPIVLALYVVIAIIIDLIIRKVLIKLTKFTKSNIDDKIVMLLRKPIFYSILATGLLGALKILELSGNYELTSRRVIYSIVVLIWIIVIIRALKHVISEAIYKLSDHTGLGKDIVPLITNIAKIAVIIAGVMTLLAVWHVDITPIWASAGIASAIIALAAKDTLANFFGGISVYFDKPYKVGDYIELDQKERGEVVEIGIRSTRIKTRDDILISIPNSIIANSKIVNESAPVEHFRVRIPIGVAYGSDIDKVETLLLSVALENDNIIEDPEPRVRFRNFGDSSLNFELLCWAKEPALRGLTIHEMNKKIYKLFAEENVTIPFPQRDLHIISHKRDKSDNN